MFTSGQRASVCDFNMPMIIASAPSKFFETACN